MGTQQSISESDLVEIASPYVEPRLAFQSQVPRKGDNLTLIDGKTFLSTNVAGDIVPAGATDVGFFHDDTRFLSHVELLVGGHGALVLSSNTEKTFASQIELSTGNITLLDSFDLPENTIHIRRQQLLNAEMFFDRLTFLNFNRRVVNLSVELCFDADFVDVFQVRGTARKIHGQYYRPVRGNQHLAFLYRGLDGVLRQTLIELTPKPSHLGERKANWELNLVPLAQVQIEVTVTPVVGNRSRAVTFDYADCLRERRDRWATWENQSTRFKSNSGIFDAALNTATSDFHALQIRDGKQRIIAAGIPWFATIFGRDSIIAAYQSLLLNPQLAIDTLQVLARYQGQEWNDWRDEEPGKILHEYRQGEMTRCGEMPFGPYYGSVDATPLFLILLSETYNWTADESLVGRLLPAAYRALDWIDRYGDLDKDGFVEYSRRSPKGLVNQGWKDSWDANMRPDGTISPPPIAPVEVQGYVYDAKYRMASLLRSFGDAGRAEKLKKEATELAKRLDKAYWVPERGFYAMALDGEKKQLQVVASNAGHLLFARAIGRERVRAVVNRMMREDMFTGWGWRTLSQDEPIFNPLSYHRGSVWPHDNSLIAHGMALNEFRGPAIQVLTALFQAALSFRDYRLPELFCGVQRREHDEPVHYPVSCSPQAWASGAWLLMLTSVLGIRPSAQRKELNIVNPELPEWLDHLQIRNLRVGNSLVGLDFTRHHERTFCNVVEVEGERLLVNVAFKKIRDLPLIESIERHNSL
jgi:glycogen debranching enzyme